MAVGPSPTTSSARTGGGLARPRFVAGVGVLAALVWAFVLTMQWLAADTRPQPQMVAYQAMWLAVAAVTAGVAMILLTGRRWAHQLLLAISSVVMLGSLTHLLGALLWKQEEWWTDSMPLAVSVPMLLSAAACMVIVVLGSTPRTRLRYGAVATVAMAVAMGLAVAANMLAQKDYLRRSFETLGRFGPTDRTKRLIESLDQPLRLTVAYTSTDPARLGSKYGPRVLELLTDMAEYGRRRGKIITVENADSDVKRAGIIAELNQRSRLSATDHVDYLNAFDREANMLIGAMEATAEQWRQAEDAVFCGQWGLQLTVAKAFQDSAEELRTRRTSIQAQRQNPLPNYTAMALQTRQTLVGARTNVQAFMQDLRRLRSMPSHIARNRQLTLDTAMQCAERARVMMATLGAVGDPLPDRPADVLRTYIRQARETAAVAQLVFNSLEDLPGEGNGPVLAMSRLWQLSVPTGNGLSQAISPNELFKKYPMLLERQADAIESNLSAVTDEYLLKLFPQLRGDTALLGEGFVAGAAFCRDEIPAFTALDPASDNLLATAGESGPMRQMLDRLIALVEMADKLPELNDNSLSEEIRRENIVLIDIGGQTEIVPFEDVWPLKTESIRRDDQALSPRQFNGNAAIGSKILGMTNEPFATVVLAYFDPAVEPQLAQFIPPSRVSVDGLTHLRTRLEQANLNVELWNLDGPPPWEGASRADARDAPPRVLVLLPPPEPLPLGEQSPGRFSDAHLAQVAALIDAGMPAMFMTGYLWPRQIFGDMITQPTYGYADYLNRHWGLAVLNDHCFVPVVPDTASAGKFRVDEQGLMYHLPLSLFSDHVIGRPLRGQRMLWRSLCPILQTAEAPDGVSAQPLLVMPPSPNTMWVTTDVISLYDRIRRKEGLIEPMFGTEDEPGADMTIPRDGFPVAMAATWQGPKASARQPVRIVVLGLAESLLDGFIDAEVASNRRGALVVGEPPRANADLVINSIYWLVGRDRQIAASAQVGQPIQAVSESVHMTLWALCVVVAPLLVAGFGVVVMVLRRR